MVGKVCGDIYMWDMCGYMKPLLKSGYRIYMLVNRPCMRCMLWYIYVGFVWIYDTLAEVRASRGGIYMWDMCGYMKPLLK